MIRFIFLLFVDDLDLEDFLIFVKGYKFFMFIVDLIMDFS